MTMGAAASLRDPAALTRENQVGQFYSDVSDRKWVRFQPTLTEIEIAPVYHRLPDRIRAHASLCFLALILYRVMRSRLLLAGSSLSPEAALAGLRRIQHHTVSINDAAPISGVSTVTREQSGVLAALKVKRPPDDLQLSLL